MRWQIVVIFSEQFSSSSFFVVAPTPTLFRVWPVDIIHSTAAKQLQSMSRSTEPPHHSVPVKIKTLSKFCPQVATPSSGIRCTIGANLALSCIRSNARSHYLSHLSFKGRKSSEVLLVVSCYVIFKITILIIIFKESHWFKTERWKIRNVGYFKNCGLHLFFFTFPFIVPSCLFA